MKYVKTFREMITGPANVIDSFVLKETSPFQHPFSYILAGATVVIILNSVFVNFSTDLQSAMMGAEEDQMSQLNAWVEDVNLRISTQFLPLAMLFLLIPSLSLPGLFFFRDDMEGFYYNLILNSYAVGTSIIALLLLIPLWMIDKTSIIDPVLRTYLPVLIAGVLVIRIYERYFIIKDVRGWIRIISSYIVGCMIFFMLKSFSASVLGYFFFAVNRFLEIWGRI